MCACMICSDQEAILEDLHIKATTGGIGRPLAVDPDKRGTRTKCQHCGTYIVTKRDQSALFAGQSKLPGIDSTKLSCLLKEHTLSGLPTVWLRAGPASDYVPLVDDANTELVNFASIDVKECLTKWPATVQERLMRSLVNISRLGGIGKAHDVAESLTFSGSQEEHLYVLNALEGEGYLDREHSTHDAQTALITPLGWAMIDAFVHRLGSPLNPVFVAMWYGDGSTTDDMNRLFEHGISPAIKSAGYKPARADISPHNDFIMNKILGDIRAAPFIVADMTGHRNGVYFEAGFARGLGTPVIHTCKRSDFDNAHFDIKQLPHLLWDTPEDLKDKLEHWIRGSIGIGPFMGQDDAGKKTFSP